MTFKQFILLINLFFTLKKKLTYYYTLINHDKVLQY